MKKITPVILVRSLDFNRGGVTKAVIKRANTLSGHFKKVIIITTIYQQNFRDIHQKFYDDGILNKNVEFLNFFDYIQHDNKWGLRRPIRSIVHPIEEKGYDVIKIDNHPGNSYRYYKNGLYIKYKRFNEDGTLSFIDYRNNSLQRIKREEYCSQGHLLRVRHFNTNYNKATFEQYFNKNQDCILSVHVSPKTGNMGFSVNFQKEVQSFDQLEDMQKVWLKNILNKIKYPVIMSEQRRLDKYIENLSVPRLKKISILHSSHLSDPYDNISKSGSYFRHLFKNAKNFNHLVVLTNTQKKDIKNVYSNVDNLIVLPHAYEAGDCKNEKQLNIESNSSNFTCVMIARYTKAKRIDEAIHAFKHVVAEIPNAQLDIYGNGPLKNDLQDMINQLNLNKNVHLKGYTDNVHEKYKNAACSILTSEREGFGLVITESMACGTPVVSYDLKYGPSDIISNGVNGFVVENKNQKELASKIIMLLQDNNLRKNMSINALGVKNDFSYSRYKNSWIKLITDLYK